MDAKAIGMGKLIFFDIDGTLRAEEDGYLPQSTIDAIVQARANGHKTFINTGRTAMNVREDIRFMGFDGYICGCGTEILYNGETVFRHTLDAAFCKEVAEEMRACNAASLYERSDALYIDSTCRVLPSMQGLLDLYRRQGIAVQDLCASADFSFDKFVIWYDEQTDMERFHAYIDGKFAYIDRGGNFAEMVPLGFSKAAGIDWVLKKLGGSPEDTIAIGDSLNDLEMIQAAHVGVAMGNGEKLHPFADFVTKDLRDDGVAYALSTLGVI